MKHAHTKTLTFIGIFAIQMLNIAPIIIVNIVVCVVFGATLIYMITNENA